MIAVKKAVKLYTNRWTVCMVSQYANMTIYFNTVIM